MSSSQYRKIFVCVPGSISAFHLRDTIETTPDFPFPELQARPRIFEKSEIFFLLRSAAAALTHKQLLRRENFSRMVDWPSKQSCNPPSPIVYRWNLGLSQPKCDTNNKQAGRAQSRSWEPGWNHIAACPEDLTLHRWKLLRSSIRIISI